MRTKLGLGYNFMYVIRDKEGDVITIMEKIVKAAEEFYRGLYSRVDSQANNAGMGSPDEFEMRAVRAEVRKALETMQTGKAAGEVQITTSLLKDGGQSVKKSLSPCIRSVY